MSRLTALLTISTYLLHAAVMLSRATPQSVTLAWDPNPEPDITSYVVYYGTASRTYPNSTNVGNVTNATVIGLQVDQTYFFAVTARNTNGLESDFSNEVTNSLSSTPTNHPPRIEGLADLVLAENTTTNVIVQVWDIETASSNLVLTATSTNTGLLPNARLVASGTNHIRNLSVRPVPGGSGRTLLTVVVSDGIKTASESFLLTVWDVPAPVQFVRQRSVYERATSPDGPWEFWFLTTWPPQVLETNWYYRVPGERPPGERAVAR